MIPRQTKRTTPKPRGRPSMNLQRRSIGLTDEEWEWLLDLGAGCLTGGIRKAIRQLRKLEKKP